MLLSKVDDLAEMQTTPWAGEAEVACCPSTWAPSGMDFPRVTDGPHWQGCVKWRPVMATATCRNAALLTSTALYQAGKSSLTALLLCHLALSLVNQDCVGDSWSAMRWLHCSFLQANSWPNLASNPAAEDRDRLPWNNAEEANSA